MENPEVVNIILPHLLLGLACSIIIFTIVVLIIGIAQYRDRRSRDKEIFRVLTRDYHIHDLTSKDLRNDKELYELLLKIAGLLKDIDKCEADTQKKMDIKRSIQNYYIPTIHRLLEAYQENQTPSSECNSDKTYTYNLGIIRVGLSEIASALENAKNICSEVQTYDIEAELKVLHQKIQMDGLGNPDF